LTLTVYYFDQKDFNRIQETPKDSSIIVAPEDRIKIIYYQDIQSQFIVNKLQDIFVNNGLISFFEFE
jgi:preprotein translocase subunit Sec61beta